ncbi:hypothetical protein [Rhodothermus marinus]|uniref:hypothetical protein n=1 Tax=Rhodothermus marinus TaxID=29549 RepID=UPI001374B336|nr:hypothetical protein [Rhodothermus marinus]
MEVEKSETPQASSFGVSLLAIGLGNPLIQNGGKVMCISRRSQVDGAVLRILLRHNGQLAVRELNDTAGHFIINSSTRILVRYASGKNGRWRFTLREEDIATLLNDYAQSGLFGAYLILVCGQEAVGVLSPDEWCQLLDLGGNYKVQTITICRDARCQMEVTGTRGRLAYRIPAARFPRMILGQRGFRRRPQVT